MKQYLLCSFLVLSIWLTGCASNRCPYLNMNLTREQWMQEVDTDPNQWTRGADRWFLTGDPNWTELANRRAPYSDAMSTMMVRVPDFTSIKVNGNFQVQIFGTYDRNSVFLYGPNDAVRAADVQVKGTTLCINQVKGAPSSMRKLIIRVGINYLNSLVQMGCGSVEGIRLRSGRLYVTSAGSGNIYLAGNLNLQRVINKSSGSISIFGANTPWLDIKAAGTGAVNVSGHVGVKAITHHGAGNINIIGATGDGLKILADGCGKIGINGQVGVREIRTRETVRVYAYTIYGCNLYVYVDDNARVGLAGSIQNLYVDTNRSGFFAGRYLCAENAFVRARDTSHINVSASNKIFAAATQRASVYFFGSPNLLSQFVSGNGTVIPIFSENMRGCTMVRPRSYKGEGGNYSPHYQWKYRRSARFKGEG